MLLLRHKTQWALHLYKFPEFNITDNGFLVSLWTFFIFFGWLMKSLLSMTAIEVKHVSPILHFDDIVYFAVVRFCFKVNKYFFVILFWIHPQTKVFSWIAKYNTYSNFINFLQDNLQNTPNMDVVIPDTYLNIDLYKFRILRHATSITKHRKIGMN